MSVRGDMTIGEARAWLPDTAIRAIDIDATLAGLATAWSRKWFAGAAVRPFEMLATRAVPLSREIEWLLLDRDLAIGVPSAANATLASLMLDLELPCAPLTPDDDRLLSSMRLECVGDLCRRTAEAFRLDAGARWAHGAHETVAAIAAPMTCTFGVESHFPLAHLLVANDALVERVKAGLPPIALSSPLSGLAQGLAAQRVAATARIGGCKLTLAEFAELSIGDVLVFDHAIDRPLDLLVNGRGVPVARCTIAETDGRLDLTLLDAIGG